MGFESYVHSNDGGFDTDWESASGGMFKRDRFDYLSACRVSPEENHQM